MRWLLLWGQVGTGKSYLAGCIANALMEREIPVCVTGENFRRATAQAKMERLKVILNGEKK